MQAVCKGTNKQSEMVLLYARHTSFQSNTICLMLYEIYMEIRFRNFYPQIMLTKCKVTDSQASLTAARATDKSNLLL